MARAAAVPANHRRRGRSRSHAPRRVVVHGSIRCRGRRRRAPRSVDEAGHERDAPSARRATRSPRSGRRLVSLRAGPRAPTHASPGRAGAVRDQVDPAGGRRVVPARAHVAGATAPWSVTPRPGVPEPGRGLGPHDRHRPVARGGRLRGARPRAFAPQAQAGPAPVHRARRRLGRRRPPAQQRALVGGVRRRRADRRRRGPPRRRGPTARALAAGGSSSTGPT